LTGGGRALFPELRGFEKLHLLETRQYNTGVVFLNYGKTV